MCDIFMLKVSHKNGPTALVNLPLGNYRTFFGSSSGGGEVRERSVDCIQLPYPDKRDSLTRFSKKCWPNNRPHMNRQK